MSAARADDADARSGVATPALAAAALTGAAWAAAGGASLPLLMALPALVLPAMATMPPRGGGYVAALARPLLAGAVGSIPFLAAAWDGTLEAGGAARGALVVVSFSTAAGGLSALAARLLERSAATLATMLLGGAWLFWPLAIAQRPPMLATLVLLHPPLAINAAAIDLGIWTQRPGAYRITRLGQDIPYALPSGVTPCVAAHALLGAGLLALRGRGRARPTSADASPTMPAP